VDEMGLAMLDEMTTPSEFIFIILTLHSMIFVLGVLGNTSICYTIYLVSRKKPIKVTHFFIASMAVSDILMAIFCAPMRQLNSLVLMAIFCAPMRQLNSLVLMAIFCAPMRQLNSLVLMAIFCAPLRQLNSLVLIAIFCAPLRQLNSLIFKEWLFEITICSLVQFLKWCLIVQKSFIMVVISSDRNYIVTRPLKQRMKKRTAHIIVCVTYVMAIIVCVAYVMAIIVCVTYVMAIIVCVTYVMAIIVCVTYVMAMVISLSHK
jgi:hypothetical protein